jgi:hypothetical protein
MVSVSGRLSVAAALAAACTLIPWQRMKLAEHRADDGWGILGVKGGPGAPGGQHAGQFRRAVAGRGAGSEQAAAAQHPPGLADRP